MRAQLYKKNVDTFNFIVITNRIDEILSRIYTDFVNEIENLHFNSGCYQLIKMQIFNFNDDIFGHTHIVYNMDVSLSNIIKLIFLGIRQNHKK